MPERRWAGRFARTLALCTCLEETGGEIKKNREIRDLPVRLSHFSLAILAAGCGRGRNRGARNNADWILLLHRNGCRGARWRELRYSRHRRGRIWNGVHRGIRSRRGAERINLLQAAAAALLNEESRVAEAGIGREPRKR